MLKRIFCAFMCALLLLSAIIAYAQETETKEAETPTEIEDVKEDIQKPAYVEYAYAQVTTPKGLLNMRKSAKEKSALVTTLPNKAMLRVLEKGEEWSEVLYGNKKGYAMTKYLTLFKADSAIEIMQKGDKSVDVQLLKRKLEALGYFLGKFKDDKLFDDVTFSAVELFQKYNRFEATGDVTAALYAYIVWGGAPIFVDDGRFTAEEGGEDTELIADDPNSDFKCKISCNVSNYTKKDNGNVTMTCTYKTTVSGGEEPYKIKVKLIESGIKEADAPWLSKNPFTFEWYKGSLAESFKLVLVVTDANGVTVSSVASVALKIPLEMQVDYSDITVVQPGDDENDDFGENADGTFG